MTKVLLIILDGFGIGKNYPFNAIQNSKMPTYREIQKKYPQSRLLTCGEAVGLPAGIMGNSEVGHTNIGAGRVVYQELTRIDKAIREKEFFKNPEINQLIAQVKKQKSTLHLMGLLSDAGVHSHFNHLQALVEHASAQVPVCIHAFTDGRDTPPTSGILYLKKLADLLAANPHAYLGSMAGRYYAMDRDNRWDRVALAYAALTGQQPAYKNLSSTNGVDLAMAALNESYQKNVSDEFVLPVRFNCSEKNTTIQNNDGVCFFNFRSDRARELTRAFTQENFKEFKVLPLQLVGFLGLTQYDKNFTIPAAFKPQNLTNIFPAILEQQSKKQFRIAETEKYAHVTFFFNGGREQPYQQEDRVLIPSPKEVATYDLKPEMSAFEVTQSLVTQLNKNQYDFMLVNFANPDMVGHTGNYQAAIKALEVIDQCLAQTLKAALANNYSTLITADHGNIEEMCDQNDQPHTQHTLNPVPLHLISGHHHIKLADGILADVAPTMLNLLNLKQPPEMTGKNLIQN